MGTHALQGVNLGGWLVLEKWMTPTLFEGTDAIDEYSLSLTANGKEAIRRHHEVFITEEDFIWMAEHNIQAVRVPIGYWVFGNERPYVSGIDKLDWAFIMAEKYGMRVLVSLHGAPGSQNGNDHSGRVGRRDWYRSKQYREETILYLERIAHRYKDSSAFWGIELLNEPVSGLFQFKLRKFYAAAVRRLRVIVRSDTWIVYHDAFTPRLLSGALGRVSRPIAMDIHWYQFFPWTRWMKLKWYFRFLDHRRGLLRRLSRRQPVIVGEWSLTISDKTMKHYPKNREWDYFEEHGRRQVDAYSESLGWFYWTYKTEQRGIWHFRSMVEDGHIILK